MTNMRLVFDQETQRLSECTCSTSMSTWYESHIDAGRKIWGGEKDQKYEFEAIVIREHM